MQSLVRRVRMAVCCGIFAGLMSGCNLFSGMHQDGKESNAVVLVADGQGALSRGDYSNAALYFQKAMENDPRNPEARVGYAEAYLKARGFNVATFVNRLVSTSQTSGSGLNDMVLPADWGCADYACLTQLFTTLIDTLDPIAQGLAQGVYSRNDFNININVGFFYVFRAASRVQQLSVTNPVQQLSKSSTSAAALGIPQTIFDQLPDQFWWITNLPSPTLLNQIAQDVDFGVTRLRTAAAQSVNSKTINDLIDRVVSLQIQVHP